jgi:hypothetical protein
MFDFPVRSVPLIGAATGAVFTSRVGAQTAY